ncbi:MAG TPA: tRNA (adenosine(37)-N6)-threonylcarbamoyltransferase complex ATPase subunit type 1 TsaE [Vicinamibacterales bacterium]|nr:tRNA (adenosine(37)-N6)-threonylcarbamoyltransferase complex ATPase subunit type 1 TsaE [Vicinamibacterales bacterium]
MPDILTTHSEEETTEAGRGLAAALSYGATVALVGDLGAGKTAFVRGLAAGLGLPPNNVSSPTFTLVQEYRGPVTLHHVDLYRITGTEAEELGLEELATGKAVVAIEWAEKLLRPIPGAITVRFEDLGGDDRRITIER